jgi:RNA polymerase sigma-70 factor (sigma-E family)
MERWRRTAYLLCGNWHTADDLLSTALVKLFRQWKRASAMEQPEAYMRRILLNAWLDERRRPWRREHAYADPPDRVDPADPSRATERLAMIQLLDELPPRRRAVLVLRFFCDLSVEECADLLGVSTGTIKSQTARALDTLRAMLADVTIPEDDPQWT